MSKGLYYLTLEKERQILIGGYIYYCAHSKTFIYENICDHCPLKNMSKNKKENYCENSIAVGYDKKKKEFFLKEKIVNEETNLW